MCLLTTKNLLFQWPAALIFLTAVYLSIGSCFGYPISETGNYVLSMDTYLRTDLVSFKNLVDLDNHQKDDSSTYFGIDYSLAFSHEFKNGGVKSYLKLERNGPYDYDAPLFIHNTLTTSGGRIEAYRNDELLPQLEEFWVDTPVVSSFRFKIGLYAYEVGNGFSLNGGYENYGFTVARELEDFEWRFYYCRPDLSHKNHLGPRIRQEEEQEILYEHNAANFFATDFRINNEQNSIQPYIGVLADYTSAGKRDNSFATPVERDLLGTIGVAASRGVADLSLNLEIARNFGRAESGNSENKDIVHSGYLVYTGIDYKIGKIKPSFSFLASSGNKVTSDMAQNQDETLTSGKNRAFSYYSPLNNHLGDTISSSNVDILPIVAMGGGYGLNYGIPRPKTFASGDFENLLMPSLGCDFNMTEKLCIGLYGYYLSSFEKGVGMFNGEAKYLSRDLGSELDLFIDYILNKNILFSLLGGYFVPGRYYKEKRDDVEGSLFSPFVRGEGAVDNAYQFELAVEVKF